MGGKWVLEKIFGSKYYLNRKKKKSERLFDTLPGFHSVAVIISTQRLSQSLLNIASLLLPQLGFGCAEDAVGLLHLRPAVAGVVHLQAVVELVQILLHLLDLLPRHVLQTETNLDETHTTQTLSLQLTFKFLSHRIPHILTSIDNRHTQRSVKAVNGPTSMRDGAFLLAGMLPKSNIRNKKIKKLICKIKIFYLIFVNCFSGLNTSSYNSKLKDNQLGD